MEANENEGHFIKLSEFYAVYMVVEFTVLFISLKIRVQQFQMG